MKNYFKMMLLMLLLIVQNTMAQDSKRLLDTKDRKAIVSAVKAHIEKSYINLDLSKRMIIELDKNLKSNKYQKITSPIEFSEIVTEDLQSISKDLHLKIRFEPEHIAREKNVISQQAQLEMEKRMALQMAEINYGFKEVKILDGNIGYLSLNQFADIKYAEETVAAAMNFLSNTSAIIIDLRANGGGVPSMMQLLSSYFFDEKPVLLSDFYERETNEKTQLYSFENVNGKRSADKPLYILTSKRTFSASEAFTYTLKHLDRATVVGETTKGGANRTKRINIDNGFTISVPYLQPINPVTKTNWEAKGVQPNIETSEKDAFVYAYIDAVKKTMKKNTSNVLNKIGYAFMQDKQMDNALIVFRENVKLFPNDSNSWDSLGEAYFLNEDKENALKSYKKSFELDSGSESAKAMIQKLESMN
ncbi:S41 family peptidase [Flavobacterium phragmitis]|uniref:Tetratricopeptide repeat-containing protein n=1 Tax=Flavobacterium phragmitis TaxID=739143 RepID=A0A1I1LWS4_9FLAO|nr:S41 family peptidase [Flavobacterium phragmitis]SFC74773.1 Tetratricopeptide repeat-containing protein [Flavobacterium phragmitis]